MFKSVKEFDSVVHEILTKIHNVVGYSEISSIFVDENFDDALEYCIQQNMILGLRVQRTASDKLTVDVCGNPRLTRAGLKFIEDFKP